MKKQHLSELSSQDLKLYFGGTYIRTSCSNPHLKWVWVADVTGHGTLQVTDDEGSVHSIKATDLVLDLPEAGLYNLSDSFVDYSRLPARIASKGLSPENTRLLSFRGILLNMRLIKPTDLTASLSGRSLWKTDVVERLFPLTVPVIEFDEGYKVLEKYGVLGKALDRAFALSVGLKDKCPSLWYKHHYIGKALSKNKVLVEAPEMFQEALDAFQPQGVNVECI